MSNCKAFGHQRARNHAIGQTPRGVLASHVQNEFQGSAAFSIREKTTPTRHQNDVGKTPERRRHDGRSPTKSARQHRPSPPDNIDQVRPTTSTKSARQRRPSPPDASSPNQRRRTGTRRVRSPYCRADHGTVNRGTANRGTVNHGTADRNTPVSPRTTSSIAVHSTTIRKLPGSTAIVSRAITQVRRATTSEQRIETVTYPNAAH